MALKLESCAWDERDPVADASKVVEHLRSNGTIDATYRKVLSALQQNDVFVAQLNDLLQQQGLLQDGMTYSEQERKTKAKEFAAAHDKQILDLARSAIWSILTDESDAGVAADNRLVVHEALVTMLEQEEVQTQLRFQQLQQQELEEQQRQQQPSIPQ